MEQQEIIRRMHSGKLYCCTDEGVIAEQQQAQELLYDYNATRPSQSRLRQELLRQMFAQIGTGCCIELPLKANWGGKFVHLGNHVYANSGLTLVDDTHIYIGDHVMLGPNVTLCTATHPISPRLRQQEIQYNLPIHIGENVWLGGGVFVMPGVTIGENSVVGANSVVTRDIPANVVAAGNPCRILREIGPRDSRFYDHDQEIDL